MHKFLHRRVSFQAKILIPVIVFLALAPIFSSWVVQSRVSAQFERDANRKLVTAEQIFESSRDIRNQFLKARYRNLVQEPRFKSIAKLFSESDDRHGVRATMKELFRELLAETAQQEGSGSEAKIITFTSLDGESVEHIN